ncbi:MAG: hypothetical protein NC416_07290 [Eubacterium sp.]|nr:hypothetical protein [Eubacterium sp.]
MGTFWKLFRVIALLIPLAAIVIGNLVHGWYRIKCFKVKKCSDRQCRYRLHCPKYKDRLTEEDKDKIEKLIDQF